MHPMGIGNKVNRVELIRNDPGITLGVLERRKGFRQLKLGLSQFLFLSEIPAVAFSSVDDQLRPFDELDIVDILVCS